MARFSVRENTDEYVLDKRSFLKLDENKINVQNDKAIADESYIFCNLTDRPTDL